MERDNEQSGGMFDNLMNKAMDTIGGALGGSESDTGTRDSELASQARGGDRNAARETDTGVNMFDSSGDDTVPTREGDRAREGTGLSGGSGDYGTTDMGSGGYGSSGADTGYGSSGGDTGYGSGGTDTAYGSTGTDTGYGSSGTDAGYGSTGSDMGSESYGTQSDYGTGMDRGGDAAGTGFGTESGTYTSGQGTGHAGETGYSQTDEPGFGNTGYDEGAGDTGFSRETGFGSPDDADLSPRERFTARDEGQFGGRE